MIRFGRTRSINLYDKHITVVLFALFHCRRVEKVRKKMAKNRVAGSKKCYIILIFFFNRFF